MLTKLSKELTYWLGIVAVGLVFGSVIQFAVAWVEPSATPPGGNVGAPLNTGAIGQSKRGNLAVNIDGATNGLVNGFLVPYGRVGIGTVSPNGPLSIQSTLLNRGRIDVFNPNAGAGSDITFNGGDDGLFAFWNTGADSGGTFFHSNLYSWPNAILSLRNTGKVGIGTIDPSVALDIVQNKAMKVGNAYLSSGGDYVHLANNEWYDGSKWTTNGSAGALLQLTGQQVNFYKHDAGGQHTTLGYLDSNGNLTATGNVCAYGGSKCIGNGGGSLKVSQRYDASGNWGVAQMGPHLICFVTKYRLMDNVGTQGIQNCQVDYNRNGDGSIKDGTWYLLSEDSGNTGNDCSAMCLDY